jgi:hypothetical protein
MGKGPAFLILRSGRKPASRRMSNTASWFETTLKKRLLTMRIKHLGLEQ